jgi:hypothetical protein
MTDPQLTDHEMRCVDCGEPFDMRDLSAVLKHESCSGWSEHDATCRDCGASTHTNGEIVHCDCCDWWVDSEEVSDE